MQRAHRATEERVMTKSVQGEISEPHPFWGCKKEGKPENKKPAGKKKGEGKNGKK